MPEFISTEDISLNGKWKLSWQDCGDIDINKVFDKNSLVIDCNVPSDVHQTLIDNKIICNPLLGDNIECSKWFEDKIWYYKKTFKLSKVLPDISYVLSFSCVDINATLYVNSVKAAHHKNSFFPLKCDVTSLLQDGLNTIILVVDNGLHSICKGKDIYKYDHKQCIGYENDFRRIFLRKPQYSFRWDWAQRLITCGITGDVSLKKYVIAKIVSLDIRSEIIEKTQAMISIGMEFETLDTEKISSLKYQIILTQDDFKVISEGNLCDIKFDDEIYRTEIMINGPKLWWPNGSGEQNLYNISIHIKDQHDNIINTVNYKHGIRKIELIEKFIDDKEGNGFTIAVNGEPIFCKGANWVPADSITSCVDKNKYYNLVNEAKKANFNILRIWGGGRYEAKEFYEACDEAGILVWQDFMFANAYYPDDDEEFMQNIYEEISYNIKKLRNYTCVAIWCGNNEINWSHPPLVDFVEKFFGEKIYNSMIPSLLSKFDGTRPYRISSPFGGTDVNGVDGGDSHSWFFWLPDDEDKATDYKQFSNDLSKFSSEYGVMSHPCLKSIEQYTGLKNLTPKNKTFLLHDNYLNNGKLDKILLRFYCSQLPEDMQQYVNLSQYMQGDIYRFIIENYRRRKPKCSGTTFWMYNDCWGTTGWTIIDYYLRKKGSYYMVKNAYAPVVVSAEKIANNLDIYIINDYLYSIEESILTISIQEYDGTLIMDKKQIVDIQSNSSSLVCKVNIEEIDKTNVFVLLNLQNKYGENIYQSTMFLEDYKNLDIPITDIDYKLEYEKHGINILINSKKFANRLYIQDENDGEASDNFFDVIPNQTKKVFIKTKSKVKDIKISWLNQNTFINERNEKYEKVNSPIIDSCDSILSDLVFSE